MGVGKVLLWLLAGTAAYEGIIQIKEHNERHTYYKWARSYCNQVNKPLLRVGMRRSMLEPPNGDVTIDIDTNVLGIPGGVHGDERNMPFMDKEFGVCFNEHTLEHLYTAEDVEKAISECRRVADSAVLLAPSPYSIYASLFNPTHHLRLWFDNQKNQIIVRSNTWNTGLGFIYEGNTGGLGKNVVAQVIVTYTPLQLPLII